MTTTANVIPSAPASGAPALPPPAGGSPATGGGTHRPGGAGRLRAGVRERVTLAGLLIGTAVLYLWQLGASGYANEFYAAAVQAGSKSWKAFFFGSFDSSNFITVDKPPASLWPMELSARIFGFSSWSMLAPQAIEGVLAVWLLYATVRRWFGPGAGLLAGTLLALTPVAVLMFRFNNPDALMTLLIVLAAYCVTRAIDAASTRWLLVAGAVLGFSFLAKGLQPFTVAPALAAAYLVAADTSLRRRIVQLLLSGVAVIVGAGWWILAVQLTPAADRPYIGGSGDNTALGLAFGYNGFGRLTGDEGGGGNFSGSTGVGRLFNSLNGGQIAWLLPAALLAVVAIAAVAARAPRTDRARAAAIIWGGWLLVTGAVLSFAGGIIHTYYSIELAPAIAALVGIGAVLLWRHRAHVAARIAMATGVLVTGWWNVDLLHRSSGWHPWVAWLVILAAVAGAAALLVPSLRFRSVAVTGAVLAVVALGGGSAAYALNTAATPHTGSIPSAGPTVSNAGGGFGGGPGGTGGGFGGFGGGTRGGSGTRPGATSGARTGGGIPQGGSGARPSSGQAPSGGGLPGGGQRSSGSGSAPTGGLGGGGDGATGGQTASAALTKLLKASTTTWAAATVGSQSAAPLELASGKAVMAIGGFTGSDNAPTLAQFEKYVAEGKIHYFIGGSTGGGPGGGSSSSSAISTWVAAHFTSTTVGGSTVYDLTKAASS